MDRGNWKRPVVLEIFGRPGLLTVSDTLDAALVLLGMWPGTRTDSHAVAVKTCRDVLTGRGAMPALARADFIEAALEAGFHVQPETFIEEVQQVEVMEELRTGTDGWGRGPVRSPMIREQVERRGAPAATFRDARLPQDWHQPANSNAVTAAGLQADDTPTLRQLLASLAETLGMIGYVGLRGTAGLMNIHVRPRGSRAAQR